MISKERAIQVFLDHLNDHLSKDSTLIVEAGYCKETDRFLVTFDAHHGQITYPSQFDSDRIYSDMTLNDFVSECEIFIEEIRVEIGRSIVCSYK